MTPPADPDSPFTVSELTSLIKARLEGDFPAVSVRGEISNLRRQPSGHIYFSLKDDRATVSGVCFRGDAARLSVQLRDGLQIVGHGRLSVYEPRGVYQVIFRQMREDGIGRLQQAFLELKNRLEAEGLFDRDRKQTIPPLPRTVGIVTSPSGAALRDFLSILRRRHWNGCVRILPARVQGSEAAPGIVRQIREANDHSLCDVLVLSRGGGSLEDLWPFNEEIVARAVAHSSIPVISAVGHETDFTLADFTADLRAETPSAAAEWISSSWLAFSDRWEDLSRRLVAAQTQQTQRKQHRIQLLASRLQARHPRTLIDKGHLRLGDLQDRLHNALRSALRSRKDRLGHLRQQFHSLRPQQRILYLRQHLEQLRLRLRNNSHQATLQRGYALVYAPDSTRRILSDASEIAQIESVQLQLRDGWITAAPDPKSASSFPPDT